MADVVINYKSNIAELAKEQETYNEELMTTDKELKAINATSKKNAADISAAIKRQEKAIKELNAELKDTAPGKVKRDLKRTIDEITRSMNVQKVILKEINSSLSKQTGILAVLKKRTSDLEKARDKANNPKRIERINALLKKNNERINTLTKSSKTQNTVSNNFAGILKKISLAAAAAFAVKKLVQFGKEAFEVALKAEGVQIAFEKLNDPNLLDELRESVGGTVTDLKLMQAAVRAKNFKIPLENLGGFFEFAAQRASDTGQNVDFLVDSIVDGIGRKSSLVLDNLGISAAEIQEEFKKTGDFAQAAANIIEREVAKSGDAVETNAAKVARLSAGYENLKLSVGNVLLDIGGALIDAFDALSDAITGSSNSLEDLNEEIKLVIDPALTQDLTNLSAGFAQSREEFESQTEAAKAAGLTLFEYQKQLGAARIAQKAFEDAQKAANKEGEDTVVTLASLKLELDVYQKALNNAALGSAVFTKAQENIAATQAKIDTALGKSGEESKDYEKIQKEVAQGVIEEDAFLVENFKQDTAELKAEQDKRNADAEERAKRNKELQEEATRIFEKTLEDRIKAEEDALAKQKAIEEQRRALLQETINLGTSIIALINTRQDAEISAASAETEAKKEQLQKQANNEVISKEQLDAQLSALDEQQRQKEAEIKTQQFRRQKAADVVQSIINTALAIGKALPNVPLSILAGAAGAVQTATIVSQPVPQFEKGGLVEGGEKLVRINERGEEFVISAKPTKKYMPLLEAINKDDGKQVSDLLYSNYMPDNFAQSLRNSIELNFSTSNLEDLQREAIKSSNRNTRLLAKVISEKSKNDSSFISRKQSRL